MMVLFWIILTVMILIAFVFTLWPFFRTNISLAPSHNEANIQFYKNQLAQLDQDLETQTLTPGIYRQIKKDIERGLLQDVTSLRGSLRPKQSFLLAILLVFFIPIFSISIYLKLGDSNALKKYYIESAHATEINAEIKKFKSPQQLINKMLTVLQQHPESAEGWFLLGRLYTSTNQLTRAQQTYAKAIEFSPANLNYKLQYAETDFFANQQTLSQTAASYLAEVIQKQPNNLEAINLAALVAFSAKHYQVAINQWEKLLTYFPASSSQGQVIMRAIQEAELRIHPAKPAA